MFSTFKPHLYGSLLFSVTEVKVFVVVNYGVSWINAVNSLAIWAP